MPKKTNHKVLELFDRNVVKGRVVVHKGRLYAVGHGAIVSLPDDGSGGTARWEIDSGSSAEMWLNDVLNKTPRASIDIPGGTLKRILAETLHGQIAIIDPNLRLNTRIVRLVTNPFLKKGVEVTVSLIDFEIEGGAEAGMGARFKMGDAVAHVAQCKPAKGDGFQDLTSILNLDGSLGRDDAFVI